MYTVFDEPTVVDTQVAAALAAAVADRKRYDGFMAAAEAVAAARGLVVGGGGASRLLLGVGCANGMPDYAYEFYSDNALADARALADRLHGVDPGGLGHYVMMAVRVPFHVYTVTVDGRDMFTVTAMPRHRGIRLADAVIPSVRPGQFGAPELLCLGPELQLIKVYTALCSPARAKDWPELLGLEAQLRAALPAPRAAPACNARPHPIVAVLMALYAGGASRVVVGAAAVAALGRGGKDRPLYRLQVVTASNLETEGQEIVALGKRHGATLQYAVNDPKVPVDSRIRRLTVYACGPSSRDRREAVADVYNAAAHETVPYREVAIEPGATSRAPKGSPAVASDGSDHAAVTVKVGTPFAILRFLLTDIWTIRVLEKMTAVSGEFAADVIAGLGTLFGECAAVYDKMKTQPRRFASLLPVSDYIGRAEDHELALKRAAQADRSGRAGHPPPPYYPARAKEKNKKIDLTELV
jgi:hypothetical protein